MSKPDEHLWDLKEGEEGNLPASEEAYDKKFEEWQARDWPDWLAKNLTFPFDVTRDEDDDDAYFLPGADKAPFRLGHEMEVMELADDDIDRGVIVKVREKGQVGYVPLMDLKVRRESDANFWPVREYVVWFANRG